jgi:hypothetical protein
MRSRTGINNQTEIRSYKTEEILYFALKYPKKIVKIGLESVSDIRILISIWGYYEIENRGKLVETTLTFENLNPLELETDTNYQSNKKILLEYSQGNQFALVARKIEKFTVLNGVRYFSNLDIVEQEILGFINQVQADKLKPLLLKSSHAEVRKLYNDVKDLKGFEVRKKMVHGDKNEWIVQVLSLPELLVSPHINQDSMSVITQYDYKTLKNRLIQVQL